ncbi:PE-PPE domain-containing protein [Mycobacterium shimoidei]|uniref:PPE family protein PPE28 [Mycobacterium tuberculosis H37Rv] n=1 Tax=Mycobacterium shimoidei TaxID=29313 RepID=A0A1E3TN27_MYCSH|nr:PE-PPE domain-containing protein [Mycobacterium shimoidei]MCV7259909.1 PE-PPE domain-containing protein [Mycobacterium shimoidei]ODR15047.1 hypothetical protein BHQ16_03175 [Mycobacterium shimoidei]ORW79212.1 hypothetical protein AWC26_16590 [Mycobacterium shimoidei]SRX94543.1 PPE family protein PPE28 [Mycobacterium tuberculosis H37Rv] [Mycobacterium shimoidei]
MARCRLGSLSSVVVVLASAVLSVSLMTPPSAPATEAKSLEADAVLMDTESLIVGPSGVPIPPQSYIDAVSERFIDPAMPFFPGQPVFSVDHANAVFTPEGLQPLNGIKVLPLDPSVAQGATIVENTIDQQLAAGNDVVYSGYSQSSTIASQVMRDLLALPMAEQPTADQLSFVLLADPNNPDGGLLSRFGDPTLPPLTLPSLQLTFSPATPSNTVWETAIYTREYDGFADFPKYPINFLSTLNAFIGLQTLHSAYPELTPEQLATAVEVPTSAGYTGATTYWMIPTEHLPLAELIRQIPVVGTPLADLLEPDLRVLVNLGYGPDPDVGWSTTGADLPTPFGLFPTFTPEQFDAVVDALVTGTQDGFTKAVGDLQSMDLSAELTGLFAPAPGVDALGTAVSADPITDLTDIVNALSGAASAAYSSLLGLADIANALVLMPVYDLSLFMQEVAEGDLLGAVGMPIAADIALGTLAAGFSLTVVTNAVTAVSDELAGLFAF